MAEHDPDCPNRPDHAHDSACEYDFWVSDEELDAVRWLLGTLDKMCQRKGPNALKADLMRKMLSRTTDHVRMLHHTVHELEHFVEVLSPEGTTSSKEMAN